ncbi:MAG: PD-(D/E)XK nuclease family protein, partial [Hyphomonadaceae bacterium]
FLDVFVQEMIAALGRDDPFALADALILLPNRRAANGLMDAFAKALGGAALLPAIRPLGDLDDDPDVWGAGAIDLDLAPAIDPLRRRLELAALIRKRDEAEGGAADPVRALAFADELCRLLDAANAGDPIEWSKLDDLTETRAYAAHWARNAQFLQIITRYWPERLKADGLVDASDRRSRLLISLAAQWELAPPRTPIVIAGSTGSIAATRVLMNAVARLEKGAVLLPGLDVDLDERAWMQAGPQHPQHALKETLGHLGMARGQVRLIGAAHDEGAAKARRVLIREALVPADTTADWVTRLEEAGGAALAEAGASGLSLVELDTEEEEAAAIALLLRESLEGDRNAALVTPDATLARRVAMKLARWGVKPLMTQAGLLETTPVGVFLSLLGRLSDDTAEPAYLAGLIAHPFTALGMDADALKRAAHHLERDALRGPRKHTDLASLAAQGPVEARELVGRLMRALAPFDALGEETTLAAFAEALTECAERAADAPMIAGARRVWAGGEGAAAARLLQGLIEHGGELGLLSKFEAARAFTQALSEQDAPIIREGDQRIAILGPLEARLAQRDRVILGALNEGVWPAAVREDPFLSRGMREAIGLPSLDVRLGLAAHDFAQLTNAREVVMTRALKQNGAPTLASRWIWRLKTLLRAAGREHLLIQGEASKAKEWARALDAPGALTRLEPPRPRPPREARLSRISATQVETLIRDPYAVYARRILGLEVLDAIGTAPDARGRGTALHRAIERIAAGDGADALMRLIDEELKLAGVVDEQRAYDRARLLEASASFVLWLAARRAIGIREFIEKKGELTLDNGRTLSARADRIEIFPNGGAAVVDYKTGAPPGDGEVKTGLAPQLLLEAAMLKRGAFEDTPPAITHELIYWRFSGSGAGPNTVALETSVEQAADDALAKLNALLDRYADPRLAFLSKPRAKFIKPYEEYDLLARRKEWLDATGDDP